MEKCFDKKFFTFESHWTIPFCCFEYYYIETALKSLFLCLQIGYFTNFCINRLETFVVLILMLELKSARSHFSKLEIRNRYFEAKNRTFSQKFESILKSMSIIIIPMKITQRVYFDTIVNILARYFQEKLEWAIQSLTFWLCMAYTICYTLGNDLSGTYSSSEGTRKIRSVRLNHSEVGKN